MKQKCKPEVKYQLGNNPNETDRFLMVLEKKIRNLRKRLAQIEELEEKQQSTALTEQQLEKIGSKAETLLSIQEYNKFADVYRQSLLEGEGQPILETQPPSELLKLVVAQVAQAYFLPTQAQSADTANPVLLRLHNALFKADSAEQFSERLEKLLSQSENSRFENLTYK